MSGPIIWRAHKPLASGDQIPWVPKERYPIMRRYLPSKGSRALDMMQRTCTVQANFDYDSEEDALRKLSSSVQRSMSQRAYTRRFNMTNFQS